MATNAAQTAAAKNAQKPENVIKNKERKIWAGNLVQDVKERKLRFVVIAAMTACGNFHAPTAVGEVLWFAQAAMEREASM